MKKFRVTACFFLSAVFLLISLASSFLQATPKKFPKISWLEPYIYLKNTDKASQRLTYYGQMESLGVNIIVGLLNPETSPLVGGLQYYNNQPLSTPNGVSLFPITGGDNAAIFEAERVGSIHIDSVGYYFNPTTGIEFVDGQTRGRWGQAGVDPPGY